MDLLDLEVLKTAEIIADSIWQEITTWDSFAKDTIGKQLAKSADSIGANIAEAFGRFHYEDKIRFFYYSRGSIFETKYWLNRCLTRELLDRTNAQKHLSELTLLARRLNSLTAATKSQISKSSGKSIKEEASSYLLEEREGLFSSLELEFLSKLDS